MLGEKYMAKKTMKLDDLTKAINRLDRAIAACCYGSSLANLEHQFSLLPIEYQVQVKELVYKLSKEFLTKSRKDLEDLGIDLGKTLRPEEYRLKYRKYKNEFHEDGLSKMTSREEYDAGGQMDG